MGEREEREEVKRRDKISELSWCYPRVAKIAEAYGVELDAVAEGFEVGFQVAESLLTYKVPKDKITNLVIANGGD